VLSVFLAALDATDALWLPSPCVCTRKEKVARWCVACTISWLVYSCVLVRGGGSSGWLLTQLARRRAQHAPPARQCVHCGARRCLRAAMPTWGPLTHTDWQARPHARARDGRNCMLAASPCRQHAEGDGGVGTGTGCLMRRRPVRAAARCRLPLPPALTPPAPACQQQGVLCSELMVGAAWLLGGATGRVHAVGDSWCCVGLPAR
jgi:hypothetical protein